MKHLPKDARGYPIPSNVLLDDNGKPHFAINNHETREQQIKNDLCPICAGKLLRGRWLVGGPGSAFLDNGAYLDPPMHEECCHYALMACPYLAAPSYSKRVDAKTLNPESAKGIGILVDESQFDARPDVFVAIMHVGQTYSLDQFGYVHTIRPKRPYRKVEYWAKGVQLSNADGEALAMDYIARNRDLYDDPNQLKKPRLIKAGR